MEFKKNAAATTLYQLLTVLKWAAYIIAGAIFGLVAYSDVTNSWNDPSATIGGSGFAIVAVICGVIALVGYGLGKWRDSIIDKGGNEVVESTESELTYDDILDYMKDKKRFTVNDVKKAFGFKNLIAARSAIDEISNAGLIKAEGVTSLHYLYVGEGNHNNHRK